MSRSMFVVVMVVVVVVSKGTVFLLLRYGHHVTVHRGSPWKWLLQFLEASSVLQCVRRLNSPGLRQRT